MAIKAWTVLALVYQVIAQDPSYVPATSSVTSCYAGVLGPPGVVQAWASLSGADATPTIKASNVPASMSPVCERVTQLCENACALWPAPMCNSTICPAGQNLTVFQADVRSAAVTYAAMFDLGTVIDFLACNTNNCNSPTAPGAKRVGTTIMVATAAGTTSVKASTSLASQRSLSSALAALALSLFLA